MAGESRGYVLLAEALLDPVMKERTHRASVMASRAAMYIDQAVAGMDLGRHSLAVADLEHARATIGAAIRLMRRGRR